MLKFKKCMFSAATRLVTTPIFYVNAQPHIGHLYTAILADAIKENYLIQGETVYLSTGTDEHGIKIQQKAKESKLDEFELCDQNSKKFRELFDLAGIKYDDYIRTTEDRHRQEVHRFWRKLNGKISKSRNLFT
jgi:methionyl-tRNA synthetase